MSRAPAESVARRRSDAGLWTVAYCVLGVVTLIVVAHSAPARLAAYGVPRPVVGSYPGPAA